MVIDGQVDQDSSSWSPFNMRQYNLSILKPPVSKSSVSSESSSNTSKTSSMSYTSAAKSLDILRQNLQLTINEDIKMVIAKYMDGFFKPGIENIKNNLGPDAVTDDHISNFIRTILEEAKRMYPVYSSSSSPSSCNTNSAIDPNDSDYQNSQQNSDGVKLPLTSPSFGIKRESDDTDSEASSMSNASKKLKKSTNNKSGTAKNTNNNNNNNASSTTNNNNTSNNNNNNNNSNSTTSANASPTNNNNNKPKKATGPSRKHVAQWDADKLTPETLFIMGAKANKALGFAQTRGRLYVKHPALFKYASDADDKEWLSRNKLMPATGGRAYIMLLDDIEKLATDNKLNVTINYEDIKGFRVPDFILAKMKSYINTWKKQYAEEAQRSTANNRGRNNNQHQNNSVNNTNNNHGGAKPLMDPTTANSTNNNNNNTLTTLNPPPLLPPLPSMQQHQQQQHPPPPPPPQSHPSLNNYHLGGNPPLPPNNVMYEPSLMPLGGPQQHELTDMREYIHMEKPPPMYPGHQQQPQHTMPPMQNPNNGGYMHSNHQMDLQLHEALTKGDWSTVSDRSLLQYALQGSRNMVHENWNPQDSFDFINENTNGSLAGSGNMGDNSTLMQLSSDGTHLNAPNNILGQVQSPQNCELTAVLDQAFQYTAS